MQFQEVRDFFISWGLFPDKEDTSPYNKEVIDQGINHPCFNQMMIQAKKKHGLNFVRFVSRVMDAIDNAFYLAVEDWDELEEVWNQKH